MPASVSDDVPVAFADPVYREAVVDLLAVIAYGLPVFSASRCTNSSARASTASANFSIAS